MKAAVRLVLGLVGLCLLCSSAISTIIVDGNLDTEYGAAKSMVRHDTRAMQSNFQSPQNITVGPSYQIWLSSDKEYVYVFLATEPDSDFFNC